jgi:DNA helicase II / ATP-dependent DNA helicase PcrA
VTFRPTPEQRAVIHHPLAPLRVAAGAGTGKTTTVAHRIAHLVADAGLQPEEVLGLTFTNKAAGELAERVRSVLGTDLEPDRAVPVHTYHGFAAQLLGEFGAVVGVERETPVITPTFTRQLLADVVATTPLPDLDVTNQRVVERVRRLASALGDHLRDAGEITAGGDLDKVWHERSGLLLAVRAYQAEKTRLGVVDYGDLIAAAHRLISDHPWVRERIAERYAAVVLDEYQDTNPAQRHLLGALFGPGFPVTAVGDVDQTIYEWRGASLDNFRSFPIHFPAVDGTPAPTLPLTLNRRSGARILAVANAVRERVDREPRDPLQPAPGAPDDAVTVAWLGTAPEEAAWIAEHILELREGGRRWSEMAVLFRKNKDMALVRDALAARDVPFEVANLGGLLGVPEIVDLRAWLRLLDRPDDGPALLRILMGSRFRLGMGDVMALSRWVRGARRDDDADHEGLPAHSLVEAAEALAGEGRLPKTSAPAFRRFVAEYRGLVEAAQGASLVELCRQVLDATGAWRDLDALPDAARLSARLNLYRFLDLAESWSPLEGRPSLTAFLDYLRVMEDDPAEELDTARIAGADAVTLLTVHRAKGLEWPIVFLPAVYAGNFPSKVAGGYDDPMRSAESLPYEFRLDRHSLPDLASAGSDDERRELLRRRHDSQEWRIAYVAVTRARERLSVSGAWWYGAPEPTVNPAKRSPLYELLAAHPGVEVAADVVEPPPRPEVMAAGPGGTPAPDPLFGVEGWQGALRDAVADPSTPRRLADELGLADAYDAAVEEQHRLPFAIPEAAAAVPDRRGTSVTGLVTYATCPRRFYWSEVDRLPRRPSPAARRGVEFHRRVELHHRGVLSLDELDPALYDRSPGEEAEPTGPDAFQVFSGSRFARDQPAYVEIPFEVPLHPDLWVRGRIDAIYEHPGGRWEIVDFKSGRPGSLNPAARVQLQAYAVAVCDTGLAGVDPGRLAVTFAHFGGGLHETTEEVDDSWIDEARRTLRDLVDGVLDGRFEAAPSAACHGCDFLRFCDAGRALVAAESEVTPPSPRRRRSPGSPGPR